MRDLQASSCPWCGMFKGICLLYKVRTLLWHPRGLFGAGSERRLKCPSFPPRELWPSGGGTDSRHCPRAMAILQATC